jgi:acetyl esterase/lipase
MSFAMLTRNTAALAMGTLILAIELWTLLPGPTPPLLVLAVVVPELAPWGILASLLAGAAVLALARGWVRVLAVLMCAGALVCAILPLSRLPQTLAACDAEMQLALGTTSPALRPERNRAGALTAPFDLVTAFRGLPRGEQIRFEGNLPVATRDGARLGLDLYRPAAPGRRPTVIVIYGGAWKFGSRADTAELDRALAALGYNAIAVDYRHAPAYHFPTQIDDVRDAIATIARNADAWGVNTSRVAILGRSAGGELALLAAYAPEPLTIRAAIGYYAPTDLVEGYRRPPNPDPEDVRGILRAYIGGTPETKVDAYRQASPVFYARPGLPPTLLVGGARDELVLVSLQREMRDALRRRGAHVAALEMPWSNHAFDAIPNGLAGQIARYYTERFLAGELDASDPRTGHS